MMTKRNWVFPMVLLALLALTRWPGMMPQNFSAVYGLAFCAGAFFPRCCGAGDYAAGGALRARADFP